MIRKVSIISIHNDFHEYLFTEMSKFNEKQLKELLIPLIQEVCECNVSYVRNPKIEKNDGEDGFIALCVNVKTFNQRAKDPETHNEMIMFLDGIDEDGQMNDEVISLAETIKGRILTAILHPILSKGLQTEGDNTQSIVENTWNLLLQTTKDTYPIIEKMSVHEGATVLKGLVASYYTKVEVID